MSGVIYILTNPSFPQLVKIGYADNVQDRVNLLNRNPGLPYSFRIYATYDVNERLEDLKVHNMIDRLNPNLRCQEMIDGKIRTREFFAMTAETAYQIFQAMAEISGTSDRLHLWKPTEEEIANKENSDETLNFNTNRHHFKNIEFKSSLTGKTYYSKTKENGALGIYEKENDKEVISFSRPSKKQIIKQALIDLGQEADDSKTLYQLMHTLQKIKR